MKIVWEKNDKDITASAKSRIHAMVLSAISLYYSAQIDILKDTETKKK